MLELCYYCAYSFTVVFACVCNVLVKLSIYTHTPCLSTCELHATAIVSCNKHLQDIVSPTILNTYTLYALLTMLQLTFRRE